MRRLSKVKLAIAAGASRQPVYEAAMARWLAMLLLLLSSGSVVARPDKISITATPIALDPGDAANRVIGRLRYLQGWTLTSNDPRFGGLSALSVRGDHFLGLSDTGWLFSFDRRGQG